jgi:hypothetical protein
MPKKNQNIQVVKVPLRRSSSGRLQQFPRMPRLYLELIENKAKIKQDLINKEHVPPCEEDIYAGRDAERDVERVSPVKREDIRRRDTHRHSIDEDDASTDSSESGRSRSHNRDSKKFESRLDKLLKDDDDLSSISTGDDSLKSAGKPPPSVKSEKSTDSSVSDLSIKERERSEEKDYHAIDAADASDASDNLSDRLKELLGDDEHGSPYNHPSPTISHRSVASDKYSRHRDALGHSVTRPGAHNQAPTLSELEQRGGYVPKRELRDINQTTHNEQQEDDAKRELLFKFDLLRKSYPNAVVPEFTVHSDLAAMQKAYDDTVRRLSLDSSVENYKTYLVYGFMGCEFIFGNFLGFDMQGFTQQQILSMNSYEKLLIELGEKSYVPSGSKWPIELRLLFMIVMNAAFFVISKMIMKKTGANLMGMINNMQTSTPAGAPVPPHRKRKMRGPNIDLGDIPDMAM